MPSASDKDRLSPPLKHVFRAAHQARDARKRLDLRDDGGERIIAGRRGTQRSAVTEPVLRREVSTDLEALMNTINLESSFALGEHGYVRRSILNFGFPDIAHRSIDEHGVGEIEREIEAVLKAYEPRLVAGSIAVRRDPGVEAADLKIRFVIHADLMCDPLAVPVEFVADVQVDTGHVSVNRL